MASQKLGDLIISIAGDLTGLKRDLAAGTRLLDGFAGGLRQASATAAGVLGADVVRDLFSAPGDFVREGIQLAASFEKAHVQLGVLLGNGDAAKDLLADVKQLGVETGIGFGRAADEAKRLLAAGVDREQVVPTLSMLSDIAMGDRERIGRASLAYSQVRATGYVQGDELNQLRELGIPIQQAIADFKGIDISEFAKLQESRAITFRDLQGGLKALTSEGGQFYRMTARGADTIEGSFGRLNDAVEDLKREFGAVVIEEVGLRDALRDGAKFTNDMKSFINDMRPGIRFVGDVIKGTGQVVGELVRNGPLFGRALVDSARTAAPHLADLIDRVQDGVKALQNFRLDPRAAVDWAMDLGLSLGETIEAVLGSLGDGLASIYNANVRPIVDELKAAALTWRNLKMAMAAPGDFGKDVGWQLGQAWEAQFKGKPSEAAFMAERRKEFAPVEALRAQAVEKFETRFNDPKATAEDLKADRAAYNAMFDSFREFAKRTDELNVAQFRAKWNPSRENYDRFRLDVLPELEKANLKAAQKFATAIKAFGVEDTIKLNGVPVEAARPEMAGAASSWKSNLETLRVNLKKLADDAAIRRDPAADPMRAGLSGLIGGVALIDQAAVRKAREAFKLDDVKLDTMKVPTEVRLPSAAEYGSAQAAEMIARAQSGQSDGWQRLTQIEQQNQEILKKIAENTARALAEVPAATHQFRPW